LDVWEYIRGEQIQVASLYFAKERQMLVRGELLLPLDHPIDLLPGERPLLLTCRMRSLGCAYGTGAIRSLAATVDEIIQELKAFRRTEGENGLIEPDQEGSTELKKIEGCF
jgi:sulfate adenylyltransferase subunit 2